MTGVLRIVKLKGSLTNISKIDIAKYQYLQKVNYNSRLILFLFLASAISRLSIIQEHFDLRFEPRES